MIEFGVFVDLFPNDWWDIVDCLCVCVFAMSFLFLIDFEAFMGYHFLVGMNSCL